MNPIRLTQNAVNGYLRLHPEASPSGAYRALRVACAKAQPTSEPPSWLNRRGANEGYLILQDGAAALPIRQGRAVACLIDPSGRRG